MGKKFLSHAYGSMFPSDSDIIAIVKKLNKNKEK